MNGFRDQFNCHKFTVNDIIQRIRNVSNEMETKGLLADAGLKSGENGLRRFDQWKVARKTTGETC